ncbi:MAG: 50S ribosomal protein L3 [Candidatus Absconditabacteria bacterium]
MAKGGLIFTKQEMTSLWLDDKLVPVTILKLLPQEIIRYKSVDKDGYQAAVVGSGKKVLNKEKGIKVKYQFVTEFTIDDEFVAANPVGSDLDSSLLEGVKTVKLQGVSKGKGYQGVVRRHGFAGGPETHGSKFHRLPGSIGNRKPRRVNRGHPLPGHMGTETITLRGVGVVETVKVDDKQLLIVKGSIPGAYNGIIKVEIA